MFAEEYPHRCRRCRGGSMKQGTCPGCLYILDTFGASFDKPQRPARGARGLDQLRDELVSPPAGKVYGLDTDYLRRL